MFGNFYFQRPMSNATTLQSNASLGRYILAQNRIVSDYPTLWPSKPIGLKKGELYDLTVA